MKVLNGQRTNTTQFVFKGHGWCDHRILLTSFHKSERRTEKFYSTVTSVELLSQLGGGHQASSSYLNLKKMEINEVNTLQLYFSFWPSESFVAVNIMSNCITDLKNWIISNNNLMTNDFTTELLLIGT